MRFLTMMSHGDYLSDASTIFIQTQARLGWTSGGEEKLDYSEECERCCPGTVPEEAIYNDVYQWTHLENITGWGVVFATRHR